MAAQCGTEHFTIFLCAAQGQRYRKTMWGDRSSKFKVMLEASLRAVVFRFRMISPNTFTIAAAACLVTSCVKRSSIKNKETNLAEGRQY